MASHLLVTKSMSGERISFDTNLFFYSIDPDAETKGEMALNIFELADPRRSFVTLQCLGELCFSVAKKRPALLDRAYRTVSDIQAFFPVVAAENVDLTRAIQANQQHTLSFWDAMLWATCDRSACTILLTEDFQDGRTLGGVTFRNPFTMSVPELEALLS